MKNVICGPVWKPADKEYPSLEGDLERDVVVIGGGMAGYLAAFMLSREGMQVTLLEADRLFSGTTGKTTAKISCNQGTIYGDLMHRYGRSATSLYYQSQRSGEEILLGLMDEFGIECDCEIVDSYIFSKDKDDGREVKKTHKALREVGAECSLDGTVDIPGARLALRMREEHVFDPIKFLSALPADFEIFEHTRAVNVEEETNRIVCDHGSITAKTIVIATHFPILAPLGGYVFKLHQSMSYTFALNKRVVDDAYLSADESGLSLRPYAGGTLAGGGDHRTGRHKKCRLGELRESVATLFPDTEITHFSCSEDVMTFDGMPMAGQYTKSTPNLYVITGFNKWGMTNSAVCARLVTDMIIGKENPYAELFKPYRHIPKSLCAFIRNAFVNVAGILRAYLRPRMRTAADIKPATGEIVRYRGKRRAVYKDEDGKLHVIGRMCPHMHCELEWNPDARTWDCPCHGSRFDIDGNIVAEPTTKACRYEKDAPKK